jgi:hypothetical protein
MIYNDINGNFSSVYIPSKLAGPKEFNQYWALCKFRQELNTNLGSCNFLTDWGSVPSFDAPLESLWSFWNFRVPNAKTLLLACGMT